MPYAARVALVLLFLAPHLYAQSGGRGGQPRRSGPGTGNPDEHLVPWKFLEKDAPLPKAPITLYWLPASLEEVNRSRLMTSRTLLEDTTRCVGLQIVLPENVAIIEKLGATGRIPTALLADGQGNVTRRVENARGSLRAEAVEQMLSDGLAARDEAMYRQMAEAHRQASAGDKAVAIDLYKKIWDDRCLFPLAGRDAQRALKSLGVTVNETPELRPADPYLQPPPKTQTGH
jgi:hypothetical protein